MSVKDRVQKSSQLKVRYFTLLVEYLRCIKEVAILLLNQSALLNTLPLFQQTKQTKALTGGHASKDRFKERDYSNGGVRYLANDWSPSLDDEVLPRQGRPAPMSVDEASHRKRKRKSDFPRISLSHRPNLVVGEVPVVPREKKLPRRVRSLTPEDFQHVDRVGGVLGSQSKRLRVNVDEYSEWKDIQDLLRPAPGVVPTVVTIDGNDFEEYEVIVGDLQIPKSSFYLCNYMSHLVMRKTCC
jgi:hypothetical protein